MPERSIASILHASLVSGFAFLILLQPAQANDIDQFTEDHVTTSYEILTGTYDFGDLDDLEEDDGLYIRVWTEETAKTTHDVRVNFESSVPTNALVFALDLQSQGFPDQGLLTVSEDRIFNWTTGAFDELTNPESIPADTYAEPGTGKIRLQVFRTYSERSRELFDVVTWVSSSIPFDSTVSVPTSANKAADVINSGSLVSGSLSDLVVSDDSKLVYQNQLNSPVVLDFETLLCEDDAENPGSLRLYLESSTDTINLEQTVSLFNWQTGEFDQIDSYAAPAEDELRIVDATGSAYEYVKVRTGAVRWRIQWLPVDQPSSKDWQVSIDQAVWFTESSTCPVGWEFFANQQLRIEELLADHPDPNDEIIKRLHLDYTTGFPSVNPDFWLRTLDFSGSSWAEFRNPPVGVFNEHLGANISFNSHETSPTLIAPQVITFAWHCRPSVPDVNQIWIGQDGIFEEQVVVTEIHRINGDVGIGKLSQPIQNPAIKPYRVAAGHVIPPHHFAPGGSLDHAKTFLSDKRGKVFLGKVNLYGRFSSGLLTDTLGHEPLPTDQYPSETLIGGDSSNPFYFLAPNDELILVSSHQTAGGSPAVGAYADEINAFIQSPEGFNLPDQQMEVYDLRTPFVFLGDINSDGIVSLLDVQPFVDAIGNATYDVKADINKDGTDNLLDVAPFVDLLTGS